MLRIQRDLLAELLLILVLTAAAVTAVVFLGVSLRVLRDAGGAFGAGMLWEFLPNILPLTLVYSLPFAWLTATALVFGRRSSDRELVGLMTAGIHLRTLMIPALTIGTLLGIGGMYYNGWVVPVEDREMRARLRDYLPQFLVSLRGADRSVTFDLGRLSFQRWDEAERAFRGVELDRTDRHGRIEEKVVAARLSLEHVHEGTVEDGVRLDLQDAFVMRMGRGDPQLAWKGTKDVTMGHVQRVGVSMLFNDFLGGVQFSLRPRDMTVPELLYALENDGIAQGRPSDVRIALHGRLAMGAAAFFFGLFAMAMAMALPVSGHRVRDFTLCTAPAVLIFYPLQIAVPTISRGLGIPPWLAMWTPSLVLFAASVVLLVKVFRR